MTEPRNAFCDTRRNETMRQQIRKEERTARQHPSAARLPSEASA